MKYFKVLIFMFIAMQIFPCSILTVEGRSAYFIAGNEDYIKNNSSIKFVPGSNGNYGYAVMGVSGLIDDYPQIAINEKGLAVDWATVPTGKYKVDKSKKKLSSPLIHELMRKCKDVDEVVKFVQSYNISHFAQGHLMVADSKGNSVVLEWDGKKVQQINREGSYQLLTNFNLINGDPFDCDRYMKGGSVMNKFENPEDGIVKALNVMHQEGKNPTLYSYVIDLNSKVITLYNNYDYSKSSIINLDHELAKGEYLVDIASLEYN